jgi:hypothetical protein
MIKDQNGMKKSHTKIVLYFLFVFNRICTDHIYICLSSPFAACKLVKIVGIILIVLMELGLKNCRRIKTEKYRKICDHNKRKDTCFQCDSCEHKNFILYVQYKIYLKFP